MHEAPGKDELTRAWIAALCSVALTLVIVIYLLPLKHWKNPGLPGLSLLWVGDHSIDRIRSVRYIFSLITIPVLYAFFSKACLEFPLKKNRKQVVSFIQLLFLASMTGLCFNISSFSNQPDHYFKSSEMLSALAITAMIFMLHRFKRIEHFNFSTFSTYKPGSFRFLPFLIAFIYTLLRILPQTHTDSSYSGMEDYIKWHLPYFMSEFSAAVNGRTMLVDFFPMYQNISPHLFQPFFWIFGTTKTSFTQIMGVVSLSSLLSVFYGIHRITNQSWKTLVLYLPFAGMCFYPYFPFSTFGNDNVINSFNYYAVGPLRHMGPWLLFALNSWYTSGLSETKESRFRIFILGFFCALVAINSPDFGIPTAVGTITMLAFIHSKRLLQTLSSFFTGVITFVLSLCVFTLVKSGQLPDFHRTISLYSMILLQGSHDQFKPEPGSHWFMTMIFLGSVLYGFTRIQIEKCQDPEIRKRAALVIFSGITGAGCLMYHVGQEFSENFVSLLPAFALSTLLLFEFLTYGYHKNERHKTLPLMGLLFLVVFFTLRSLNTPSPVREYQRLFQEEAKTQTDTEEEQAMKKLVLETSQPGEKVLIMMNSGHTIAVQTGIQNMLPYTAGNVYLTVQLTDIIDSTRKFHVKKIYALDDEREFPGEMIDAISKEGFQISKKIPPVQLWTKKESSE